MRLFLNGKQKDQHPYPTPQKTHTIPLQFFFKFGVRDLFFTNIKKTWNLLFLCRKNLLVPTPALPIFSPVS